MDTEALTSTLLDRVNAGVEFLDENLPEWNWRALIDTDELAVESTCRCVLGQLGSSGEFQDVFGFNETAAHLGIADGDTLIALGFEFDEMVGEDFERDYGYDVYEDPDIWEAGYHILTDLWVSVLNEPT